MARVFPFFKRQPKAETRTAFTGDWDLKGTTLLDLIAASSQVTVSPEEAMKAPAVLAAVSLRSGLFASFPKIIYKVTDSGREEVWDDPLYKILAHEPNPYMNAYTFWELVNTHLDLWGNSYVYISRYGGNVKALTPIHPRNVTISVEGGKMIYKVKSPDPVLNGDHSPNKILHFKDISYDGIIGQSRVALSNDVIAIYKSSQQFSKEFFDKGGNAKGVIETDQKLDPEAIKNFVKHWNDSGNHGTPILDMGKKYKQLSIPIGDANLKDIQDSLIQEIARTWHVPSSLINENSRSTYSNVTQLDIQFVKYGLRPSVKRYEHELEYKLLGDDRGKKLIRFNLDGILRGDPAARAAFYAAMKQNEIMSSNEIRKVEGLNPSDDPRADLLQNPATTSNTNNNEEN